MAKQGLIHDYDLMANREESAKGQTCQVCGASPMAFQWSDYHGEGMCCSCGTPYQLRAGSDEMQKEGAYPYLTLKDEFVPVVREYHAETGRFTCLGIMLGPKPGMNEFISWLEKHHPELLTKEE